MPLSVHRTLTAQQRIDNAVVKIMQHKKYVAFSAVLMLGERKVVKALPPPYPQTAATDGRNEWYVEKFVDRLTDASLRFVILHEAYHKVYRDPYCWHHLWQEDPALVNMACDYINNNRIIADNADDKFAYPCDFLWKELGVLHSTKYDHKTWDAGRVYYDLKQNGHPKDANKGNGQPSEFDGHMFAEANELSEEEQKALAKDINEAIRQGALMAGKMGSSDMEREFNNLAKPQVDWRQALRDFVTSQVVGRDFSTYAKPNRRYVQYGVFMPSGVMEQVGDIVACPDMSGSIGNEEVTTMLSELAGVCETVQPEKVSVMYWSTVIHTPVEHYEGDDVRNMVQSTKPHGTGGTDPECIPAYLNEHSMKPKAVIVLTDGYVGSWGRNWPCPVLWLIIDNESAVPPHGVAIHVKSLQQRH